MFGFTDNYFIIFAIPLVLRSGGQCAVNCGSPILRELDDDYNSDLIVHFVPRNSADMTRRSFMVNTRQQGFIYHTINCFEHNNSIIVDAFVSKLNASRESSQFELNNAYPVLDNEGDAFRYEIYIDPNRPGHANVRAKLLAVQLDSSIDFHCVDPHLQGQPYTRWFMISHRRERDVDGSVNRVVSTLSAFLVNPPLDSLLDFDPNTTLSHYTESTYWSIHDKVYLRTPLYIPGNIPDDDRILCWCYEDLGDSLKASLLVFTTGLQLVQCVYMNQPIPYSVHSWVALRNE